MTGFCRSWHNCRPAAEGVRAALTGLYGDAVGLSVSVLRSFGSGGSGSDDLAAPIGCGAGCCGDDVNDGIARSFDIAVCVISAAEAVAEAGGLLDVAGSREATCRDAGVVIVGCLELRERCRGIVACLVSGKASIVLGVGRFGVGAAGKRQAVGRVRLGPYGVGCGDGWLLVLGAFLRHRGSEGAGFARQAL